MLSPPTLMEFAMRRSLLSLILLFSACAAFAGGCSSEAPPPQVEQPKLTIDPAELTAFAPLPDAVPAAGGAATDDLVNLGRMLYFEPRLSKSQKISCNTCHDLATYGVDNQPTSDGHKGQLGDRNSPTVYNAAGAFRAVLGRPRPGRGSAGEGPGAEPCRNGHDGRTGRGQGPRVDARVRRRPSRRRSRTKRSPSPTTTWRRPSAPSSGS